jgi:hypothetical protein
LAQLVPSYAEQVEKEFGAIRYLYGYSTDSSWRWQVSGTESASSEIKRRLDPANIFNATG